MRDASRSFLVPALGLVSAALVAALPAPRSEAEAPPRLSLPIACAPGRTCFVQSYVDVDAGPDVRDFACGSSTYDGHTGTDFRVLSLAAARREPVAVLAAAEGTVRGRRDGMADTRVEMPDDRRIQSRECGNGLVLVHGGGWETQYCHLLQGSVAVAAGDKVARGQRLGSVGNSGLAAFPHLHFEVRKDGRPVDPFTGNAQEGSCLRDPAGARGLWDSAAAEAFPYAGGEIIAVGFSASTPTRDALENDHTGSVPASGASTAYFFARVANIRTGDRVRLTFTGPGGFNYTSEGRPLPRPRQLHIEYALAKTSAPDRPLPAGSYRGRAELLRDGRVIAERSDSLTIR